MSVSILELVEKNNAIERQKRELEMEALQSQINPHFLYNTLNIIKWMAVRSKANDIVECIITLGNILQPIYKSSDTMCPLRDEFDYVQNYVRIMNLRFGNGIILRLDVPDQLLDYKIPKFILQPIIENSITHGYDQTTMDSITISVVLTEVGDDIHIEISNNGVSMSIEKLNGLNSKLSNRSAISHNSTQAGIGLFNVNRRLRTYFGDAYGLYIRNSTEEGTCVLLRISKLIDSNLL